MAAVGRGACGGRARKWQSPSRGAFPPELPDLGSTFGAIGTNSASGAARAQQPSSRTRLPLKPWPSRARLPCPPSSAHNGHPHSQPLVPARRSFCPPSQATATARHSTQAPPPGRPLSPGRADPSS